MSKKKETKQKTTEEALSDPVYVNYNLLKKLEDIKAINYGILEIMNEFLRLSQEQPKQKEEREGTFKSR